ncbi:hypothetical protein ABK040_002736 [Willaertia magna]
MLTTRRRVFSPFSLFLKKQSIGIGNAFYLLNKLNNKNVNNKINDYYCEYKFFSTLLNKSMMTAQMTSGKSSIIDKNAIDKNRIPMIRTKSGKHIQYVDQCFIKVKAGDGGNGIVHFAREKYKPIGKPSGGDGGNGGNVIIKAVDSRRSLCDIDRLQQAANGERGENRNKNGPKGKDHYIYVPLGTQIFDAETGELVGDLQEDGSELLVARGGKGGLGNQHFKSGSNRSPQQRTEGKLGEKRFLKLKLKSIADVGLLGYPNAGKSTLLGSISNVKPKVAAYSFTTLHPLVGEVYHEESGHLFTCADIPGVVEGMNEKRTGLGHDFLQHIERTKLLLYVIDVSGLEGLGIQYDEETGEVKYEFITEDEVDPFKYEENTMENELIKEQLAKKISLNNVNKKGNNNTTFKALESNNDISDSILVDYLGEEEAETIRNEEMEEEGFDNNLSNRMSKRKQAQERFRKRNPLLRTIPSPNDINNKSSSSLEASSSEYNKLEQQEDTKEENKTIDPIIKENILERMPSTKRKNRFFQPWDILKLLKREVELYMPGLSQRAKCIIANKMDVPGAEKNFEKLKEFVKNEFGDLPIIPVSAKDNVNIENIKVFCAEYLYTNKKESGSEN